MQETYKPDPVEWFEYHDSHTIGTRKTPFEKIYIEAAGQAKAGKVFESRLGHNPNKGSCHCCGLDFSTDSASTLEQLTGWNRHCRSGDGEEFLEEQDPGSRDTYVPLEEFVKRTDILVLRRSLL